ncbi:MAG: leucyl/phenylalanyl-tRNA--protein transferase [Parashewanella sp.]
MHSLKFLTSNDYSFPAPDKALEEPNGLIAIGGDLSPERLLSAYANGIFPWFNENDPILWWSPSPRAVLVPGEMHISKSLAKFNRKHEWEITINHAFEQVIHHCAEPRVNQDGTWITEDIQQAYIQLHKIGRAHSLEVWDKSELIGGLYGINVGRVFCGESMFHKATNASKIALLELQKHLLHFDYALIDTQMMNDHLLSLGVQSISREEFINQLNHYRQMTPRSGCWQPQVIRKGSAND